jgi:hypothetical protein
MAPRVIPPTKQRCAWAWSAIDQFLYGAQSTIAVLIGGRSLELDYFGAFASALAISTMCLGLSRATFVDPYIVAGKGRELPGIYAAVTMSGLVFSGIALFVAVPTKGVTSDIAKGLAVLVPASLLHDLGRLVLVNRSRSAVAVCADLAVLASLVVQYGIVSFLVTAWDVRTLLLIVACSYATGALVAFLCTRVRPRAADVRAVFSEHRPLSTRYLGEFVVQNALSQIVVLVVAAISLTDAGRLRLALLAFGPTSLLVQAAAGVMLPGIICSLRRDLTLFLRDIRRLSGACALVALISGAGALLLPSSVIESVIGPGWSAARPLILPLTAGYVLSGLTLRASIGLKATANAGLALKARLLSAPTLVCLPILGQATLGALGCALGIMAANAVVLCLFARNWSRASRQLLATPPAFG